MEVVFCEREIRREGRVRIRYRIIFRIWALFGENKTELFLEYGSCFANEREGGRVGRE